MDIWILWTFIANYAEHPIKLTVPEGENFGQAVIDRLSHFSNQFWKDNGRGRIHIFGEKGHVWSGPASDLKEVNDVEAA